MALLLKNNLEVVLSKQRMVRINSVCLPLKADVCQIRKNVLLLNPVFFVLTPFFVFASTLVAFFCSSGVSVYALRTVNMLRKYSSFLDIPMSFLLSSVVYVAGPAHWTVLWSAMGQHGSQFLWFRKLYMLFSR